MAMAEMSAETLPFRSLPTAAASAGDCPSHAMNARPRAPASQAVRASNRTWTALAFVHRLFDESCDGRPTFEASLARR
jgi:hypothetical protein